MYPILRREAFSETTFLWEVLAPDVARSAQPGHFVMLRLHDGSERIPLTVADYARFHALKLASRRAYNAANDLVTLTDALGRTTTYGVDALGRVISKTLPDGSVHTTAYDGAGRPIVTTTPLGIQTKTAYDGRGNIVRIIARLMTFN